MRIDLGVVEGVPIPRIDDDDTVLTHPRHRVLKGRDDGGGPGVGGVAQVAHVEAAIGLHEVSLDVYYPPDPDNRAGARGHETVSIRGLGRCQRPVFAKGPPSTDTMSAVKS